MVESSEDPWFVALSILALAAAICIAACTKEPSTVVISTATAH